MFTTLSFTIEQEGGITFYWLNSEALILRSALLCFRKTFPGIISYIFIVTEWHDHQVCQDQCQSEIWVSNTWISLSYDKCMTKWRIVIKESHVQVLKKSIPSLQRPKFERFEVFSKNTLLWCKHTTRLKCVKIYDWCTYYRENDHRTISALI